MNLNVKLIALDMDGTLLTSDKRITSRTHHILEAANHQGIAIVICSGRVISGIRRYLSQMPFIRYIITSNGASVYDLRKQKTIYQNLIPMEKALRILESYRTINGLIEVYRTTSYMYKEDYDNLSDRYGITDFTKAYLHEKNVPVESLAELIHSYPDGVEKFNLSYFPTADYAQIWNRLNVLGALKLTYSDTKNIEINTHSCDKGIALTALANHLHIPMSQVMAFGDSHNDRQMLLAAGLPIVMGNAETDIKALSDTVILSNDEEGIADYLEKLLI